MTILIVQHNYGRGYESTIMILEIALNIGAEIVILDELFIGNQKLAYNIFNFIDHEQIEL